MFDYISNLINHPLSEYKNRNCRWSQFEECVFEVLIETWGLKNYMIQTQKTSKATGKRVDFYLQHPNDPSNRVVIDAKWAIKADYSHIEQIVQYKKNFLASRAFLLYPENVEITDNMLLYAREKNITVRIIERIKKKKEKIPGIIGFIKPKKYRR
jgi:hypothetical protein